MIKIAYVQITQNTVQIKRQMTVEAANKFL